MQSAVSSLFFRRRTAWSICFGCLISCPIASRSAHLFHANKKENKKLQPPHLCCFLIHSPIIRQFWQCLYATLFVNLQSAYANFLSQVFLPQRMIDEFHNGSECSQAFELRKDGDCRAIPTQNSKLFFLVTMFQCMCVWIASEIVHIRVHFRGKHWLCAKIVSICSKFLSNVLPVLV